MLQYPERSFGSTRLVHLQERERESEGGAVRHWSEVD